MFVSGKKAQFSYIVSRIRVIKRRLIPHEEYKKLLAMDFHEILKYLEETEYKKEIDEFAIRFSGPKLLDYSLTVNLYRTFKRIQDIAVGLPKDLIKLYYNKFIIYNVMTILKGKFAGYPEDEIEANIVPVGYTLEFYKSLIAKTPEEIVSSFEKTPFYKYLSKLTPENIGLIEDQMYKDYYMKIVTQPSVDPFIIPFRKFIRMEVDIKNVKTLLRLKREDVPREEIIERIIPGGYQLTEEEAKKLAGMSWDELVKSLEGYWFWQDIEITGKDISRIEVKLDKAWIKEIAKKASYYPVSIIPVLQFIVLKKVEVDNLRTLGWGKWQGIPNEEIEEQLVIL
jgi:V/A-type H+-transporting ATPase subunit C